MTMSGTDDQLTTAKLQLAQKAMASARATAELFNMNLQQEAEGQQRMFLESFVFMAYFSWFPTDQAFVEWYSKPKRPLDGRQFPLRAKVESEIQNKLDLSFGQRLPVQDLFKVLSNTAVHPTRETAEWSWREATVKFKCNYLDPHQNKLRKNSYQLISTTKRITFLIQLQLFLQAVRVYVLKVPEVPYSYALRTKPFLESYLELMLTAFKRRFALIVKQLESAAGQKT
jgi:hypothetical protein